MKVSIKLDSDETTELIIRRNWFTGVFVYIYNDQKNTIESFFDVFGYVGFRLKKEYEFEVGQTKVVKIKIVKTRPIFLAGIREQTYDIFIDEVLYKTYKGY